MLQSALVDVFVHYMKFANVRYGISRLKHSFTTCKNNLSWNHDNSSDLVCNLQNIYVMTNCKPWNYQMLSQNWANQVFVLYIMRLVKNPPLLVQV